MKKRFISKPHERTNTSYDIGKKRVLTSKFDSSMLGYRSDTRATDDLPEVRVYMSSIWIYRRGLTAIISHITYSSHNYKLQMCPGEAFVDMAVTE
eukprot:scaffold25477_cov108-Skeletonema_menzelii.AAC.1